MKHWISNQSGGDDLVFSEVFTQKNMNKENPFHALYELDYISQKSYPHDISATHGFGQFISLQGEEYFKDYYIGFVKKNSAVKKRYVNKEDEFVYEIEAHIYKLNRNVIKEKIDYSGDLKPETIERIKQNVLNANPNINNVKDIKVAEDKLIIETWNRYYTGVAFIGYPLEDLYTRVTNASSQTENTDTKDQESQTKSEVKVKYQYQDGKVYKEYIALFEKNQVIDSSDLEMLDDNMSFNDDFVSYTVKGDGNDSIIRIVKKSESNAQTQTENTKTENKETQTEITKNDISKIEKESKVLQEKLDKLNKETKDKDKLNDKQKEKIKELEERIDSLKEKLDKGKEDKNLSQDMKKEMDKLIEKIKELDKKMNELGKTPISHKLVETPVSPTSQIKLKTGDLPQTSVRDIKKDSLPQDSRESNTKDINTGKNNDKEKEIRYPNKLTPKQPSNNSSNSSQMDDSNKNVNTNKGVASAPSKARGTVTENKDNANNDYPIHHNDSEENKLSHMYSADARQFVTFTTKNGKTFHLIINHDEDSENVVLLTEVSEDDLLNMVEKKEEPKQEITKDEPVKEEPKPMKKEESSNTGTYLILALVVVGALGAGYYFKVIKKKEDKELEDFEEEDDDFFSEAEESENELDESLETEDEEDDELE
ncbi:CD1107 family mobile element protein [Facklamia sp. P13055]|uniref:CD1107 family mobile element protein n=1 Tax=Facklamia sp. P13055 TaxID=3421952 RepID=UPI003D16E3FF